MRAFVMSLNWKEINVILEELDLPGLQIQRVFQSAYDVLGLQLHGKGKTVNLLIALTPGACRIHESFRGLLKGEKPLRFAEFCKSQLVNGWIREAKQLGDNRIISFDIGRGSESRRLYIRLWSNAANAIVTDDDGMILDVMRRSPKRGEMSGGIYRPELSQSPSAAPREYRVRELPGEGSFNRRIDDWYAEHGGALSLEALREQARKRCSGSRERLEASLERLREKEADYEGAEKFREYGDIIMASLDTIKPRDSWLETENFFSGGIIRIKLDPAMSGPASAEQYYQQYRKAKSGLQEVLGEIAAAKMALQELDNNLESLLAETNPLILHRRLKNRDAKPPARADKKRPGLSFRRKEWLIIVGRDGAENDELLRRHVKGQDLWLHTRDYAGSYVFIKGRSGKSIPLDILLDAGNLALFYSKGRNNGEGDLFYTQVKFLRRAKNGKRGLVIPTQEKNLHIKLDAKRLKELELCRIEKHP